MNRVWPLNLQNEMDEKPGRVYYCEPPAAIHFDDCPNCGGIDTMAIFVVDAGPYRSVPRTNKVITYVEDAGWMVGERKFGSCPVCSGVRRREWLEDVCGLIGGDINIRIDQFRDLPGKGEAKELANYLLSMTPHPYGFATFYGDYGVGKTMLLKALVNGFRVADVLSVYILMSELLASVRETFGSDARNAGEQLIAEYKGVRVLAIDEVDRVNMTKWAQETMFRLINARYEAQGHQLTIMASNVSPDMLPPDLEYLGSRMNSGLTVEVGGDDVRPALGQIVEEEWYHNV